MTRKKVTEAEVAATALEHFAAGGWDCYPEVSLPWGGRADIVATRPFPFMEHRTCVHIIECKTSWSLSLLEQAMQRIAFANYVTIIAPTQIGEFYERLCRQHGIGVMKFARRYEKFRYHLRLPLQIDECRSIAPRPVRHRRPNLGFGPGRVLDSLHEDMKRYTPGTQASSGYSTPWRRTMDTAAAFVQDNPGCTVNDVLASCEHHYANNSSAKQGFLVWLQKRGDIEARKEGRCIRFYPPGAPSVQVDLARD